VTSRQRSTRMLSSPPVFSALLLWCCLSLAASVAAGPGLPDEPHSAGELDRAFEVEVYHLLQQRLGAEVVRYVRITRFRNTLLLTGEVHSDALRAEVDAVVLEAAGIRREADDTTGVVPARTRNCGGRPVTGNVRRKQIVRSDTDCSALRAGTEALATGHLYNHLGLVSSEPDRHAAVADVLAAQARLALVEAGYPEALDRDVMRIAAQGDILYAMLPNGQVQSGMRAVLLRMPGVSDVRVYTE
jgi:hypothetical protein